MWRVGKALTEEVGLAQRRERREIPPRMRLVAVALTVVAVLGVTLIAARLTDQAWFCRSCHEMDPYVAAWQARGNILQRALGQDRHAVVGLLSVYG